MKPLHWLVIVNLLYLIPSTIYFFMQRNIEFLSYIGVVVFLGIIVLTTFKASKIDMISLWLLSFWGFIHMMGGLIRFSDGSVLYGLRIFEFINRGGDFYILKMDQVIHFYGFFVAAVIMYQLFFVRSKKTIHPGMLIFFATIGSMGLGALNEVIEFTVAISIEMNGVGDLYNMGLDLMFNTAGALTGAFFENWRQQKFLKRKK